MDAVLGATKPANVLQVGGNDGTNAYGIPLSAGGAAVLTSGTFTGTITGAIVGTLTHNNAAPSTNNIGALTAVASAAGPTYVEGDQVLLSVDLAGNVRTILNAETTKVIGTVATGAVTDAVSTIVQIRTPNVFKTASVSATASGNTAVWTPTSGKKFRLMRFQITGTNIVATAATVITISFQDATTGMDVGTYDILMPTTVGNTALLFGGVEFNSGWVDLGNGVISAAANNVLNANISATVMGATGSFRYSVAGTEE